VLPTKKYPLFRTNPLTSIRLSVLPTKKYLLLRIDLLISNYSMQLPIRFATRPNRLAGIASVLPTKKYLLLRIDLLISMQLSIRFATRPNRSAGIRKSRWDDDDEDDRTISVPNTLHYDYSNYAPIVFHAEGSRAPNVFQAEGARTVFR
jgi:hypothetical protein